MPPIESRNNNLLSISLADKTRFRAGETIVGTVTRTAHMVDSDAVVTIKFQGRCKTKIVISNGQSSTTYRGRYNFWEGPHRPVSATLYRGPVHVPPNLQEPQSWPFAITIPTSLPEDTIKQEKSDATFLQLGDPETTQLPGSYILDDDSFWGSSVDGYVDYHLEAALQPSKGSRLEATLPIRLDGPSSPIPITDFGLRTYRGNNTFISTHRLNPALAEAKLTFGQKAQEIYGSSKLPMIMFQVVAHTPSVLQIGNPNIIPFHVQGFVNKERTSEVLHGLQPTLFITKFSLRLTSTCNLLAPSTFSTRDKTRETTWSLVEYVRHAPRVAQRSPSPSPSPAATDSKVAESSAKAADSKTGDSSKVEDTLGPEAPPDADTLILPLDSAPFPLDLGQALEIRLPERLSHRVVTPSFKTFNIQNTHVLEWEMKIDTAGKDGYFAGKHAVNIMPPSEEDTLPL